MTKLRLLWCVICSLVLMQAPGAHAQAQADHRENKTGKVILLKDFYSVQLNNKRDLRIYLPPSYRTQTQRRYPVIYMHDGQNLFDAKTASFGTEWEIDETMDRLIGLKQIQEAIIVGIDNTHQRLNEYTPCCDPKHGGGKINDYEAFLLNQIKPFIDQHFRTKPDRNHTFMMGSSLGGLATFYMVQRHPETFSKAASLSGAFWWNKQALVDDFKKMPHRLPIQFYLDTGTPDDASEENPPMRDALLAQGYQLGKDLIYIEIPKAQHNEAAWAARVDVPLKYLLGVRSPNK